MGYRDHYYTRREIGRVREHHFLRVPQEAQLEDGVPALLGALSEKGTGGYVGGGWPTPLRMGSASQLLGAMEARRAAITERFGTPVDAPFRAKADLASTDLTVERRHMIGLGANAAIPGVPAEMSLKLQMEWITRMKISWGEGTTLHHIPVGFLDALHDVVGGDHTQVVGTGVLRKHFIVQSVIVSRSYAAHLTSERAFTSEVKARAAELERLGVGVRYAFGSERTVDVSVEGDRPFLVAVDGLKWRDLDRSI